MIRQPSRPLTFSAAAAADSVSLPPWVASVFAGVQPHRVECGEGTIARYPTPRASLLRYWLPNAIALDAMALEAAVRDAYQQLLDHVPAEHPFVVRCWHYLPAITQPMDAKRDRYMAFNAGRFAAFEAWFGGELRQARHLPAASAVGLDRDDLWIDLLAVRSAGCAVENPRQIPAVRYSAAYGPRPPCFSRACRIDGDLLGRPVLLIAGTASIRGEATIHPHQLSGQLEELVLNFRSLLATEKAGPMLELRAYYREPSDRQAIAAAMKQAFGERVPVQFVRADLCRADLQVEVEAVASLATEAG